MHKKQGFLWLLDRKQRFLSIMLVASVLSGSAEANYKTQESLKDRPVKFISESALEPSPSTNAQAATMWKLRLFYAQSSELWSTIDQIKKSSHTVSEINDLLDENFNHPQEGIASFGVQYVAPTQELFHSVFSHGYVGARVDALAGGVAKNRIFPEVKGYQTKSVEGDFGFYEHPIATPNESAWEYQLGSAVGLGTHEHLDALALDFYPKAPIKKTNFLYWGLDLKLGYHAISGESLHTDYMAAMQPTFFHSDFTPSSRDYELERNTVYWRWRGKTEWIIAPIPRSEPILEFSLMAIVGQQPVPEPFLPRTWDAVHQLQNWPSPGQLLGLGTGIGLRSDDAKYSLKLNGGFFGGYLGATADLRLKSFFAGVKSLGLEQSSGYRVTESRIKSIELGIRHEF